MDFSPDLPIYLQIATQIKEQILKGALLPGQKLPSVREYSLIFEVSPLTVQRAMQHLDDEKLIYSKKGVGSFVAAGGPDRLADELVRRQARDFVRRMRNCGLKDQDIWALIQEVTGDD